MIDNFATIGQDYAGTGLSSPNRGGSKKVSVAEVRNDSNTFKIAPEVQRGVDAYHEAFHGKAKAQGSEEDEDEDDVYGRAF